MVKRIVVFALCIIFSSSVFVSAQSADDSPEQSVSGQENMAPPQGGGGRMGRGPGGMGGGRGGMQPPGMENPDRPQPPAMPSENTAESDQDTSAATGESGSMESPGVSGERENMQPPEMTGGRGKGGFSGDMNGEVADVGKNQQGADLSAVSFLKDYSTPVTSLVLLILAFVFVKFYKKKTY